jgi:hypothetical protein
MADYTSRATVKEFLGVPAATTSEDDAIDAAINAAESSINGFCGRSFVVPGSATAKVYRPTSDVQLDVDDIAQLTSLVVKTDTADDGVYDTTLTLTSEYIIENNAAPYRIIRRVDGSAFPRPRSNRPTIEVTAYWGYAMAVPAPIIQAATTYAARLYQRRSAVLGFQPGMEGDAIRISRIDPDLRSLLSGYRLLGIA